MACRASHINISLIVHREINPAVWEHLPNTYTCTHARILPAVSRLVCITLGNPDASCYGEYGSYTRGICIPVVNPTGIRRVYARASSASGCPNFARLLSAHRINIRKHAWSVVIEIRARITCFRGSRPGKSNVSRLMLVNERGRNLRAG